MRWVGLLLALTAGTAQGSELHCVATEQCRGDAERMCARAETPLRLDRESAARGWLWIERRGPYAVERQIVDGAEHWVLKAFGGSHRLELGASGHFRYIGNRGKRYFGTCAEDS